MKNEKDEDPNRIKRLLAEMDFATKVKIAQEANKKNRSKKPKK
jgi:hypothetical protein